MKKIAAEPVRDIDFSQGRRGAVVGPEAGKTKISIRLDNRVLAHFRALVEKAGEGNYQTLINDALVAHIERKSVLDAVRRVVREEIAGKLGESGGRRRSRTRAARLQADA
jgi:uncharacterized protein (DUF4415 family)